MRSSNEKDPRASGFESWLPLVLAAPFLMALACGPRPLPAGYAGDDVRDFVVEHRHELQREIKIGSGEKLYELGILAGCQNPVQLERRLHRQYASIFSPPDVSDAEAAERMLEVMTETRELRCLDLELGLGRMHSAGRRHIYPWRRLWR